jgi:hypothetical protein
VGAPTPGSGATERNAVTVAHPVAVGFRISRAFGFHISIAFGFGFAGADRVGNGIAGQSAGCHADGR